MTEEVRQALRICPPGLRQAIDRLPDAGAMEELRLRCGQPPACRIAGKERALPLAPVTPELLRGILEQATQRSAYAMQEMTRCGFVTLPGGHRLGICGTAVVQNGTITALREPSSLNLRIARQPDGIADRLRDALWAQPQSVLLCGAPGSGKTTIGTRLAAQLGRTFLDADTVLEQKAGMNIPEIFRLEGEDGFRQLETAVLAELGKRSGLVIATGGGCVTRPENYPLLHQNGTIFCLTRDLSRLPISGRPVSQALGAEELYRRRKPLYEKFADAMIDNDRTVEDAVRQILEVLG